MIKGTDTEESAPWPEMNPEGSVQPSCLLATGLNAMSFSIMTKQVSMPQPSAFGLLGK
jgi:hypothetical protein